MLDFSFGELIVIAVVALVVIGPERLPRVARTAGHLLGRFQRYVSDVKADINREIELSELKNIKSSVEDAARSIENTVKTEMEQAGRELRSAEDEFRKTGEELKKTEDEIKTAVSLPSPHMGTGASTSSAEPAPRELEPTGSVPPALASATSAASFESPSGDHEEAPPSAEHSPQLELGLDSGTGSASASSPQRPA